MAGKSVISIVSFNLRAKKDARLSKRSTFRGLGAFRPVVDALHLAVKQRAVRLCVGRGHRAREVWIQYRRSKDLSRQHLKNALKSGLSHSSRQFTLFPSSLTDASV